MRKNAKICAKTGDGTTAADLAYRRGMERRGESGGVNIKALHLIGGVTVEIAGVLNLPIRLYTRGAGQLITYLHLQTRVPNIKYKGGEIQEGCKQVREKHKGKRNQSSAGEKLWVRGVSCVAGLGKDGEPRRHPRRRRPEARGLERA